MPNEFYLLKYKAVKNLLSTSILRLPYYEDYKETIDDIYFFKSNLLCNNVWLYPKYYLPSQIVFNILNSIFNDIFYHERKKFNKIKIDETETEKITRTERFQYIVDYAI